MILNDTSEMLITSRNITYYKDLGYKVEAGNKINININHLPKFSRAVVQCKCVLCEVVKDISYEKYLKNTEKHGFYSCKKCSNKKRTLTSQSNWGVDNYSSTNECKEKVERSNIKKYGVKTTLLHDKTKDKIKKTNLERYGVECPLESKEIRNKGKETFIEKYGVDHFSKTITFKNFMKQDFWLPKIKEKLDKLNIQYFIDNDQLVNITCQKGHIYKTTTKLYYQRTILYNTEPCSICNPIDSGVSGSESKMFEFIKENYSGNIICSDRSILNGKELDIYIPDLNIAFEYNGLFWHSELFKSKIYHLDKSNLCLNKNIQLIHIYEDEWLYKNEIVKSRILNILKKSSTKIFARKCEIRELTNVDHKTFMNKTHIQGNCIAKYKIGLFYNSMLVAVMSFNELRKNLGQNKVANTYELLRFSTELNVRVIGGASKLLKYFIKKYQPVNIISYADRSWSTGTLYNTLGFNFISYTTPSYWYVKRDVRYNRWNFRKDILVNQGEDPNKSEHEIMLERGYYRIYNSGNLKYSLMI